MKIVNNTGLYKQQNEAIRFLQEFLNSNDYEATLSGYAGTGKTHLLKYFINNICNIPTCITAPTHTAVRQAELSVGKKGKTLQSLHGLRPNTNIDDFDIGNPRFDPLGQTYIKNYGLIIIDEASMISDSIIRLNLDRAIEYGVKILYVGDPLQLPPIVKGKQQEKISSIFNIKRIFHLTDVVRQEAGNSLLELFPIIRSDIKNNTNNLKQYLIHNRININNNNGYEVLNNNSFIKSLHNNRELLSSTKSYKFKLLAYTNDKVKLNNHIIRNDILQYDKDIIEPRDLITSYTTIVDEFNNPIITNGDDYSIEQVRDYVNPDGIKVKAVNFNDKFTGIPTTTMQVVDHNDKSFLIYYKKLKALHTTALTSAINKRGANWAKYYEYKNKMLTMVPFKLNGHIVKKDIDYGYAITVHKSQGSTYNNVFIDLEDILYSNYNGKLYPRKNLTNRLLYVALSRAQTKVTMKL